MNFITIKTMFFFYIKLDIRVKKMVVGVNINKFSISFDLSLVFQL